MPVNPPSAHTLSTPETLEREELLARWVGRGPLLRGLVDRLARGPGEGPVHRLIVGAPGTGRSALLARLRVAVQASGDLAARWRVLVLPPRAWGQAQLADLWLEALEVLAEEEPGARARLGALLAQPPEDGLEAAALDALLELSGRNLLLAVDRLDVLLTAGVDLGALATRLREEPRLTLVATADAPIKERRLAGLWKTEALEPLSADESRELLTRLCHSLGSAPARELLARQPERALALVELLGGRPADLVPLAAVWALSTEGDAGTDLLRWVDLRRPELRSRLEALPPQALQIATVVAEGLDACPAGQVAERTRLDVRLVSAQLNRLVQNGVLDKARLGQSARLGFLLRERPLSWCLLRRADGRARLEGLAELRALLAQREGADPLAPYGTGAEPAPGNPAARQKALAALRQALPGARRSWPAPWTVESFSGVLLSAPLHLGARQRIAEALPELDEEPLRELAMALALQVGQLGLLFGEGFNRALAQASLSGEMAGPADASGAEAAARRLRTDGLARFATLWAAFESPTLDALNAVGSRLGARLSAGEALLWAAAAARARQPTLLMSASAIAWSSGGADPVFPFAWLLLAGAHPLPPPPSLEAKAAHAHPGLLAAHGMALGGGPDAVDALRGALAALRDPEEVASRLPEGLASYYFDSLEDGSLGRALLRQLRAAPRRALIRALLGQADCSGELGALLGEEEHPRRALLLAMLDTLRQGQPERVLTALEQEGLRGRWAALEHAAQARLSAGGAPPEGLAPETRVVVAALLERLRTG